MIFGDLPLPDAEGAILAHSVRQPGLVLKKGRRLTREDIAALGAAGLRTVAAAKLEAGDIHEDEAAERLARAVMGSGLTAGAAFTGRVNLFASEPGVAVIDGDRVNCINQVDEAITIATLDRLAAVQPGQMVATVKIIPFAAPDRDLLLCEEVAAERDLGPVIRIAPFRRLKAGLIQTVLPGTSPKMLDKTARVTADRLAALGCALAPERRCAHSTEVLADEIRAVQETGVDLLLIAGASAITDRRDVLPSGIEAAGGDVEHFGMPVDPGNLMLLARLGRLPVLGLPGCARSPKLNGFDWVLQRLVADVPVTRADVMALGVGGLLTEIPSRPQPRAEGDAAHVEPPRAPRIAAIVLAAGRSTRMGHANKLLAEVEGTAMIVRAVDAALSSRADPVLVVTGHQREQVEATLGDRPVRLVHNPNFADGLSTSLQAGLSAAPADADGALVCLGDMPRVTTQVLNRLIDAYDPIEHRAIVVPTFKGKRGNPVLWDRRFFSEMIDLKGDVGARHLIGVHGDAVVEIELSDDGVTIDVDTPEALSEVTRRLAGE